MGVLDKFLDIMKLSDDDEYDEDDFFDDDEYDDEYEEKPKKSIFRREKTHDESDEDDYELPSRFRITVRPLNNVSVISLASSTDVGLITQTSMLTPVRRAG